MYQNPLFFFFFTALHLHISHVSSEFFMTPLFLRGSSTIRDDSTAASTVIDHPTATAMHTTHTATTVTTATTQATDAIDTILSAMQSATASTPYDDLITCMWNGTNVGKCHALGCKWCHASFTDICVTNKYASHLNGTVFACEGGGGPPQPSNDDDDNTSPAPSPPRNDDDLVPSPTTPSPVAPMTPSPTPTKKPTPKKPITNPPSKHSINDDTVPIITDDDPNHTANDRYMKRLLHCMAIGNKSGLCLKDDICTWCTTHASAEAGLCFSKQAAKQMDGAYYICPNPNATMSINDESDKQNEYEHDDDDYEPHFDGLGNDKQDYFAGDDF